MTTAATVKRAVYELPLTVARANEAAPLVGADGSLLLRHACWFCRLRWLVAAAMCFLAATAHVGDNWLAEQGFRLPAGWPLGVAAALAVVNLGYTAVLRKAAALGSIRESEGLAEAAAGAKADCLELAVLVHRVLWLQILVDLAVLTVVVHFLGSVETVAPLMYLFHIVLACIFFSPTQSLTVTVLAMAMYLICVVLESAGVLAPHCVWVAARGMRDELPPTVLAAHAGLVAFISGTVWYLSSRLAGALQQRDAELAATNRRLMAATDERARHMLQTTHQLKAPFAAIHANTQLLQGGFCGAIPDEALKVIAQIAARCDMLAREIKAMLQLANLRSSAQAPPPTAPVELHEVLRGCVAAVESVAAKRDIAFVEDIAPATILGIHDHVVMMLDNVLSNAVAYSFDGRKVSIACRPVSSGGATVSVEDAGIGIPAAKLPQIFDDYYRTAEAVKHNKASTGLGLAIVRHVALAGKVRVRVESAPNQGTQFTLDFPARWGELPGPASFQET